MHGRYMLMTTLTALASLCLVLSCAPRAKAKAEAPSVTICIDAGHGGENTGVLIPYDGTIVAEKDLNLKIARYLRTKLSAYKNTRIVMTRTNDRDIGLAARVSYAVREGASFLISIHNNQASDITNREINGCMVLLPCGHYNGKNNRDLYAECTVMGNAIIDNLTAMGLRISTDLDADKTGGLLRRPFSKEAGARKDMFYPDGSLSDYYGLIRSGVEAGLPTIIIEHAYVSNEEDYRNYLSSSMALQRLARADAKAIAAALGLSRK